MTRRRYPDVVIVDRARLPDALADEVRLACSQVRVSHVDWPSTVPLDAPPLLMLGALAAGERRVPPHLLEIATQTFPGLPLLLLCTEPLVRRVVSLHGGRVNLLGPPLVASTIGRRIAALLADRRTSPTRYETLPMGLRPLNETVVTAENERALWWTATVTCHGSAVRVGGPLARVRHHIGSGITAFIPFSDETPPTEDEMDRLLSSARTEGNAARVERIFSAAIGESGGVIHLNANADEWTMYWPRSDAMLEIASATRFPTRWDVAKNLARTDARACRMRAASGDLVVALSSALPGGPADAGDLAAITGPNALRAVEGRLREAQHPAVGMLAEVL